MDSLDKISKAVQKLFSGRRDFWVIRRNISPQDIKTCKGTAYADLLTNTCALCVALNNTVFLYDNKPKYYHMNCKCGFEPYSLVEVKLDFPMRKITEYLFTHPSKAGLMESMGYNITDAEEVYFLIAHNAQRRFLSGDYELSRFNNNGQRVNIVMTLMGKREKTGRIYTFVTGWMAYPNGELHNNTPFGDWVER